MAADDEANRRWTFEGYQDGRFVRSRGYSACGGPEQQRLVVLVARDLAIERPDAVVLRRISAVTLGWAEVSRTSSTGS